MKRNPYQFLWLLLTSMWLLPQVVWGQQYPSGNGNKAIFRIKNCLSNWWLESGGWAGIHHTPGNIANVWNYENTANQQWLIVPMGPPAGSATPNPYANVTIVCRATGMVLGVNGSTAGDNVRLNYWDATQSTFKQLWNLTDNGGCWTIRNAYSGQVLEIGGAATAPGAQTNQWPDNSGSHQRWQLEEVTSFEPAYTIRNIIDPAYFMEVELGDKADGVPILQAPGRGAGFQISNTTYDYIDVWWAQQQWFFRDMGNNEVAIINRNSQKALQVKTSADGEAATQASFVGSNNQLWYVSPYGGANSNWYYLKNKMSGLFLATTSNVAGDKIQQKLFTGSGAQTWQIDFSAINRPGAGNPAGQQAASAASQRPGPADVLSLYPNPATSTLALNVPGLAGEPTSVLVTDVRGGRTPARYQGNGTVDVAGLAPGLYYITVSVGAQQYRQKFVKE